MNDCNVVEAQRRNTSLICCDLHLLTDISRDCSETLKKHHEALIKDENPAGQRLLMHIKAAEELHRTRTHCRLQESSCGGQQEDSQS